MARPPMRTRTIRVDDKTWDAAIQAADERDETLSEEIRKMIIQYVAKG